MHDRFIHANTRFAELADQVPEATWLQTAAATPEWTFRQLIEHIIANNYAAATSLAGIDQPPTADGVPLMQALQASTEAANQAAAAETDPTRMVTNQYGAEMSAEDVLRMGLADRSLHYWDLALSLGKPADDFASDEDAQIIYDFVGRDVEEMRKLKVFGPEVPVPADASIQHRLLGMTGRDPAFRLPA